MRPQKLIISAFGPYKNEVVVDFTVLNNSSIYLITGDTGSGKTTIFDALVFALYGSASGNVRENSALRSKYSSDDTKTYVELTFVNNNTTYTVRRNPEYLRPSKRGDGLTKQSAEASLEFDDEVVVGYKAVNEKIEEVIGINKEQYSQIAMIAQGEFLKLLLADTTERIKIFRNIFQTNNYKKLQDNIKRDELETKKTYEALKNSVLQYVNDIVTTDDVLLSVISNLNNNEAITTISECLNIIEQSNKLNKQSINTNRSKYSELSEVLTNIDKTIGQAQVLQSAKIKCEELKIFNENNNANLKTYSLAVEKSEIEYKKLDILKSEVSVLEEKLLRLNNTSTKLKEVEKEIKSLEASEQQTLLKQVHVVKKKIKYELELNDLKDIKDPVIYEDRIKNINEEILKNKNAKEQYITYQKELERLKTAEEKYLVLKSEYDNLNVTYLKEETLFFNNQAGILAEKLVTGEPCLVCGATNHPNIATNVKDVKSEKELIILRNKLTSVREELANKSEEVSTLRSSIKTIESLVTVDIIEIEKKNSMLNDELVLNNAELNLIKVNLIRKNEVTLMLNAQVEELKGFDDKLYDINNKQVISMTLEKQLQEEVLAIGEVSNDVIVDKKEIANNITNNYNNAKEKYNKLNEQITNNNIQIDTYKLQLSENKIIDLTNLLKNKEQVVSEINTLNTSYDQLNLEYSNNIKVSDNIKKVSLEIEGVEVKYQWLKSLSDTVNGSVSKKERIELEAFVQMSYFDQVINRANTRFMIMSGGQFELLRRTESSGLRSKGGLELDVIDHYNGTIRGVKTLSGGESFMASLSLALGLSDEIQASSGGINIESMFVDEGFGTLSDDALTNAIKILSSLAQSNKMIGIISHVNELKESIDSQICVTKTIDGGSKVDIIV